MKKSVFLSIILLLLAVFTTNAQDFKKIAKFSTIEKQFLNRQYYGGSVAIDGNYAVVGSKGYEWRGAAFVLHYNGISWETIAKLTPFDGEGGNFGESVSISGNNIVVGASVNQDKGAAYVFTKPSEGWKDTTETAKLIASNGAPDDYFGYSVSIYENNIVVGAYGSDHNNCSSGVVYIFTEPIDGWKDTIETAKLIASNLEKGDYFGCSVSIDGDNVAVGAFGDDDNGNNSGSAYVFTKPSGGWSDMTETAKLTASDGASNDHFGNSVSISGDNVVIGARYDDTDNDPNNGQGFGSAYVFTKPSSGWGNITETAKLISSDLTENDSFGYSVSIYENNIVIGAHGDDDNGSNSGSAYVFTKPSSSWKDTTETAKLIASDGEKMDHLAYSVGISGKNIISGAYFDDDNGENSGAAYIFTRSDPIWKDTIETQKISANYTGSYRNYLGEAIAIDNKYAVVGATGYNRNQGLAYILYFNENDSVWEKVATLKALNKEEEYFGCSVSISGDNIVVGAFMNQDKGVAYVFTKPIGGWVDTTETAKLTASNGSSYDYFGYSVSISGNNIIVGAYENDANGNNSGSAYVFTKPSGGWEDMTETAKLKASDIEAYDTFGKSVSISGDNIIVGASVNQNKGAAYVFTKPSGGWTNMTETAKLTAPDAAGYQYFGTTVYISDNNIVVSSDAYKNSVYVFTKPSDGWATTSEAAMLKPSSNNRKNFGRSVSISEDIIVVGAPEDNINGENSGTAYIFIKPSTGWTDTIETTKLIALDETNNDYFGYSVSILNDRIAIGAYKDGYMKDYSGSAYLFKYCGIIDIVDVIEETIVNQVNIYPNPTKGIVNIDLGELKNVSINLSDISGKVIYTAKNINSKNYQFELNQKSGVYFIQITSDDKTQTFKLIKQ